MPTHFLTPLTSTSDYYTFILKINQMKNSATPFSWTLAPSQLSKAFLAEHQQLIKHLYLFVAEYLHEQNHKKQVLNRTAVKFITSRNANNTIIAADVRSANARSGLSAQR